MEVAGYFDLEETQAREIAVQVAPATSRWRDEAATQRIAKTEIDRMSSAFEHEDLSLALGTKIQ
jgi:serine/threonine-protein kinase HipA